MDDSAKIEDVPMTIKKKKWAWAKHMARTKEKK